MTFLIVDDHRINLLLIKNYLEPYMVDVYSASNGVEALDIWRKVDIDVLITDHYMPLMDGLELIQSIKNEKNNETICVLVTGEKNIQSTLYDHLFIKPIVKNQFDLLMNDIVLKLS